MRALRRRRSCTRSTGPRTSTTTGKRVVVIGSGATAVTLVPALAERAGARDHAAALAHVRGLVARERRNRQRGSSACCRPHTAYALTRWKNVALQKTIYKLSRAVPSSMRGGSCELASSASFPRATTSTPTSSPRYNPWDQRLCLVPDGDLFEDDPRGRADGRHRPHRRASPSAASSSSPAAPRRRHHRHRHGAAAAGARRRRADRRRCRGRAGADARLQGDDAERRAQPRVRDRLHQRVVDAQSGPRLPRIYAVCSHTWTRAATTAAWRTTTIRASPRGRCSTSPRATCSGRSTSSRGPAARAVAAGHELRQRCGHPAARQDRRRLLALLAPGRGRGVAGGRSPGIESDPASSSQVRWCDGRG